MHARQLRSLWPPASAAAAASQQQQQLCLPCPLTKHGGHLIAHFLEHRLPRPPQVAPNHHPELQRLHRQRPRLGHPKGGGPENLLLHLPAGAAGGAGVRHGGGGEGGGGQQSRRAGECRAMRGYGWQEDTSWLAPGRPSPSACKTGAGLQVALAAHPSWLGAHLRSSGSTPRAPSDRAAYRFVSSLRTACSPSEALSPGALLPSPSSSASFLACGRGGSRQAAGQWASGGAEHAAV